MRVSGLLVGVAMLVATPAFGAQEPVAAVGRAFGAREQVNDISLSPDGKHIAAVEPAGTRGQVVKIYATDGSVQKAVLRSEGDRDSIQHCAWSANDRLVCTLLLLADGTSQAMRFSRMIALDADGGNIRMLSARTSSDALGFAQDGGRIIDWLAAGSEGGSDASVLMTRMIVPEMATGTLTAEGREGLAVERVDTRTLRRTMVETPRGRATTFLSDGHGTVRISSVQSSTGNGYDGNSISYSYRKPGDRQWYPLSRVTLAGDGAVGFIPQAVDRDLNVAYGFDVVDGRRALFKVALDGSLKRELVFAHPQVDVDGLIRIGRQNRVVGVSYVTDKRQTMFFDPELARLRTALSKAMPQLPLISFVDASADEKTLVLFAGSDVDPGRYFLYEKATRRMGELLPVRPQLARTTLATVRPVSYPAADGTMIPGYLTLPAGSDGKGLPAIVMPHGGPGARDEWGFDWLAQFFAARGYAVLQPNFRGSTGYGDGWFQKNGFQSWRIAVGDVNDAGRWMQAQGIAAPGKLAIVGWSYGGYAALQSPVLAPDLFKAIVAIAPVTDLETLRGEARNYVNFPQVDAFIGRGEHIRAGSPAQNIAAIRAPVLLFHGDRDVNVGVGESRLMASRLRAAGKPVEYVEIPKLDHQLSDDAVRADMLERSDAFIRRAIGG